MDNKTDLFRQTREETEDEVVRCLDVLTGLELEKALKENQDISRIEIIEGDEIVVFNEEPYLKYLADIEELIDQEGLNKVRLDELEQKDFDKFRLLLGDNKMYRFYTRVHKLSFNLDVRMLEILVNLGSEDLDKIASILEVCDLRFKHGRLSYNDTVIIMKNLFSSSKLEELGNLNENIKDKTPRSKTEGTITRNIVEDENISLMRNKIYGRILDIFKM